MRSIVAMGLATFVACCLVTASWADEATPCKAGKCAAVKGDACCPACPTAKAEVSATEVSAAASCGKSCAKCPKASEVATNVSCESTCCKGTNCKNTCPSSECCEKECPKGECTQRECAQGQCATKCATSTEACSECSPCELTGITAAPISLATSASSSAGTIHAIATSKGAPCEQRRYTVKVQMMGGAGEHELAAPTITVAEGTTASVGSHMSRPFVTGVRKNPEGMAQPIITVLNEGTTIEVRVTSLANRRVQLDATIEQTNIDTAEEVESPFQTDEERETLQAPEVSSQSRRVVRAVQLGDTVKVRCGCACGPDGEQGTVVLLTVDQVGAPTPGITPITKVSATQEIEKDELYQVVYPVGDLLEPYAVHKEGAAVEAADFLPVIDMLLTETGCDWPAEAQINPHEANQSVVIAQTKGGHEAIAKYLARKRANVAEIEANLLRK